MCVCVCVCVLCQGRGLCEAIHAEKKAAVRLSCCGLQLVFILRCISLEHHRIVDCIHPDNRGKSIDI